MVYKWKEGSHHKISAQIAGDVCAELEERGELTARNLVDVSRPEEAPLHDEFEWDNDLAAELYRENQGRGIIGHLVIVADTKSPVRAYFNLEVKSPVYHSVSAIVHNEDKYASLLRKACMELKAFQKKYEMIKELAAVFEAIDALNGIKPEGVSNGRIQ